MENLWKLMPLLLIFGAFMVCMLLIDRKSLNIKSKTVGDGQHGSASFATPKEIDAAFQRVRYEPQSGGESLLATCPKALSLDAI